MRADRRARTAEEHAAAALALARSTEERADRLERIQVERRDVTWRLVDYGVPDGTICFENTGTDTAYDVVLAVDPDGADRRTTQASKLGPREKIAVDMPDLAQQARRRFEELLEQGAVTTASVSASARLTWSSESGVQAAQGFPDLSV